MTKALKMIGILNTGLALLIFILNFGKPIHLYLIGLSEQGDLQNSAFVFLLYGLLMGLSVLFQKIGLESGSEAGEIQIFQYRFFASGNPSAKRVVRRFFSILALIVQGILLFQLGCIFFQTRLSGAWVGYAAIGFVVADLMYLFLSLYKK